MGELPLKPEALVMKTESDWEPTPAPPLAAPEAIDRRAKEREGSQNGCKSNPVVTVGSSCLMDLHPRTERGGAR